jgi:DnaK suppressor protein
MIVSILQLMGFPVRKPVHSRAGENDRAAPERVRKERITGGQDDRAVEKQRTPMGEQHAQASSARRQDVKAKPGKAKAPAKTAKKVVAKPASGKAAAKSAPKAPAKKAVAVKKAPAKPVAKSATKTAKPAPKAKPLAKAPVKSNTPAKPAPKPVAKAAPKVAAKAKVAAGKKPAKAPDQPKAATVKAAAAKTKAAAPVAAPVASKPAAPAPVAPVKVAGRTASSKHAALAVAPVTPMVASTAAKSSFSPNMSTPVIVPLFTPIKKDPKLANNWKSKPVEQLSDAEIVAMPDSEYMNEKQLAFFRLKLSLLKQDILNSAGETTEHLREDTVIVPDPADRATIEEEHALELRTRDRERKLLKKIEQSIMRIDAGDYGYCDETGEPIGVGRLLARPTATLSLEAQQRRELKQKMFGD